MHNCVNDPCPYSVSESLILTQAEEISEQNKTARLTVKTGIFLAPAGVRLTVETPVSLGTLALVGVFVLYARAAIEARLLPAVVGLPLAVITEVALCAVTPKTGPDVLWNEQCSSSATLLLFTLFLYVRLSLFKDLLVLIISVGGKQHSIENEK